MSLPKKTVARRIAEVQKCLQEVSHQLSTRLKNVYSLSFTEQKMDFKCWISNTDELEEKLRLRFEEALLCTLDLYPSGRPSDQR